AEHRGPPPRLAPPSSLSARRRPPKCVPPTPPPSTGGRFSSGDLPPTPQPIPPAANANSPAKTSVASLIAAGYCNVRSCDGTITRMGFCHWQPAIGGSGNTAQAINLSQKLALYRGFSHRVELKSTEPKLT